MKLSDEQINEKVIGVEQWAREEGKWITRKYRFPSFIDAVAFVNEIAVIAEQMNHHPMISIDYRVVTIRLTTWKCAGLSELDFEAALAYDAIYIRS
jgi:4a-hydroxytetrahydrobiopterin dehydratase